MAYNPSTCPHCGGIQFHPCQNEFVNSILHQESVLVLCLSCHNLMIAKPIAVKPLKEENQKQQYTFPQ